jgi:hypothetical protein
MNGYFRLNTFIRDFILIYIGNRYKEIVIKYHPYRWNEKENDFTLNTIECYHFSLEGLKRMALSKSEYKKLLYKYPDDKVSFELYSLFNHYAVLWYGDFDKLIIDVTNMPDRFFRRATRYLL